MDISEMPSGSNVGSPVRHPWEVARVAFVRRVFERVCNLMPTKPSAVLDYGSGDGYVLSQLARGMPHCLFHGVDSALDAFNLARVGVRVGTTNVTLHRSMDELTARAGISIVLMLDVIEHLEHDVAEVRTVVMHPAVAPDAYVLVTVPAFACLFSSHDVLLRHYRRYTSDSLHRVLTAAGLRRVDSGYIFLSALVSRTMRVLLEKSRLVAGERQSGLTGWRLPAPLSGCLAKALDLDARTGEVLTKLSIQLPGLSCYAIYRKLG